MTEGSAAPVRINEHAATLPFGGGHLEIVDRSRLVSMVAQIIVGQHLHVEMVLSGASSVASTPSEAVVKAALARVGEPASDETRWHRDGWVFQLISWIAARGSHTRRAISAPHMQPTRQGFDCLYLTLEPQEQSLRGRSRPPRHRDCLDTPSSQCQSRQGPRSPQGGSAHPSGDAGRCPRTLSRLRRPRCAYVRPEGCRDP